MANLSYGHIYGDLRVMGDTNLLGLAQKNGIDLATLNDNVASATKLQNTRTVTVSGDATGSFTYDGSTNSTLTLSINNDSHEHSNYLLKTGGTLTGLLETQNLMATKYFYVEDYYGGRGANNHARMWYNTDESGFAPNTLYIDNGVTDIKLGGSMIYHEGNKPTKLDVGLGNVPNVISDDYTTNSSSTLATTASVKAAFDDILGGAGSAYDTLKEIQDELADDQTLLDTLVNGKVNKSGDVMSGNLGFTTGDGRGLRFWDSDNYKIHMSGAGSTGHGGRLDSTSDYNMYFTMVGGTNRGFAFRNGLDSSSVVAQIESDGSFISKSGKYKMGDKAEISFNETENSIDFLVF